MTLNSPHLLLLLMRQNALLNLVHLLNGDLARDVLLPGNLARDRGLRQYNLLRDLLYRHRLLHNLLDDRRLFNYFFDHRLDDLDGAIVRVEILCYDRDINWELGKTSDTSQ